MILTSEYTECISIFVLYTMCFTGNAGGYLGLFLGYTLLNVPDFLQEIYNWILGKRKKVRKFKRARQNRTVENKIGENEEEGRKKTENCFVYFINEGTILKS